MTLSYTDIHSLVREQSAEVRAEVAQKVAREYNDQKSFTPRSSKTAVEIFRLLLQDTEKQVRLALAEELKHNPHAPHDVILSLARDHYDISKEILEHSHALYDEDLLEFIKETSHLKTLISISNRTPLSQPVSSALIKTNNKPVIMSVLDNHEADISEEIYAYLLSEFRHDQNILEAMVYRGALSTDFAEKLYSLVLQRLKKHMTKRHLLSRATLETTENTVRENAIITFISPWMTDDDICSLVNQMHVRHRLTDSLILRSLCLGEITFFEASLAKRVNIPLMNARKLLSDATDSGFNSLYRASKLPEHYSEAVRVFLKLAREECRKTHQKKDFFRKNITQQIRQHNYDSSVVHMDTLLAYITASQATEARKAT
jgi:uncharacterized protein (DUF2336 family)